MFLNWATEDVVLSVLGNWQKFSAWVMNYKPEYLHGGHLIDRAGYKKFKELMLDGVTLNPECLVAVSYTHLISSRIPSFRQTHPCSTPSFFSMLSPGFTILFSPAI